MSHSTLPATPGGTSQMRELELRDLRPVTLVVSRLSEPQFPHPSNACTSIQHVRPGRRTFWSSCANTKVSQNDSGETLPRDGIWSEDDTVSADCLRRDCSSETESDRPRHSRLPQGEFQHSHRESQGPGTQVSYTQRDAPFGVTHLPCVFRPRLQCHRARQVRRDLLRGQTE